MTLAQIANIDSAQSFDILVGALRQMGYGLDEGIKLLDKWVAVSRVSVASVYGLAQGFGITGTAAETAGVNVDQLTAMIATMMEVTVLSETQAANAIRAFTSSFTTERSVAALTQFGFSVKDLDGNFRSLWDILSEVSAAFEAGALSPTGLKQIADAIGGGYRRAAQVEAMIKGWPRAQYMSAIAMNAHGEAAEALEIKMETLQIAINNLTSAWQKFAETLMETGLVEDITKIVNLMAKLLEIISDLTDAFGPFLIRLGEIAALFGALSFVGSKFGFSMSMGTAAATQLALPAMGMGMMAGAATKLGGLAGPLALGGATIVPLVIEAITDGLTDDITWKAAGTLLGGAVGGVLIGPWGAAIGMAIGQGITSFLRREQKEAAIPLAERTMPWLLTRQRELEQALKIETPVVSRLTGEDIYEARRGWLEKELADVQAAINKKIELRRAGIDDEEKIIQEHYSRMVELEKTFSEELPDRRKRLLELLRRYAEGEITRAEYRASAEQLEKTFETIGMAYYQLGEILGVEAPELFETLAGTSAEVYDEIISRVAARNSLEVEILRLRQEYGKAGRDEIAISDEIYRRQKEILRVNEELVLLWPMAKEGLIIPEELPAIFDFRRISEEAIPTIMEIAQKFGETMTEIAGVDISTMFEESSYIGLTKGWEMFMVDPAISRSIVSLAMDYWEQMHDIDIRRIKDLGDLSATAYMERLKTLTTYYAQLFASMGYYPEQQELVMMLGPQNEIFRIITSINALRFAIEDLREVEERQLEGQWNLPAGAVAWVPITSLYYQRQQAAGLPPMPGVPQEPISPGGGLFDIPSRFGAAKWEDLIYQYAMAAGIDPKIIGAILQLESGGMPTAIGAQTPWGRAKGLMQIMPFHEWRLQPGESLYDPEANIRIGVEIFRELLERYEGDVMKAVAGYYGGVIGGQISPAGEDYLKVFKEAFSNLFGTGVLTAEGMPTGAVTQNIVEIPPIEIPPIYGEFTIHNYIILEGAVIERYINRILAEALTRYRRSGGTSGAGGPGRI